MPSPLISIDVVVLTIGGGQVIVAALVVAAAEVGKRAGSSHVSDRQHPHDLRRCPRSRPRRPDRRGPGPDHLDGHRHPHHPHRHHRRDRRDPRARRHQHGVPADAWHGGTSGDEHPVPRSGRPVPGRERHPHLVQARCHQRDRADRLTGPVRRVVPGTGLRRHHHPGRRPGGLGRAAIDRDRADPPG